MNRGLKARYAGEGFEDLRAEASGTLGDGDAVMVVFENGDAKGELTNTSAESAHAGTDAIIETLGRVRLMGDATEVVGFGVEDEVEQYAETLKEGGMRVAMGGGHGDGHGERGGLQRLQFVFSRHCRKRGRSGGRRGGVDVWMCECVDV